LRENDQPRKRVETSHQSSEGSGTKTEIGKDLPAETVTETAENKAEYDSINSATEIEDGEEDDAPLSLEEMMAKLKLNKRSGEGDVEKKIKQRRR
jgi:hypothetical protein